MKTSIAILILSACILRADLIIDNNGRAIKDGTDVGTVADAVKAGTVTPAQAQTALVVTLSKLATDKDVAVSERAVVAAEKAAVEAARLELIASTKAALADADAVKAKEAAAAVIATAEAPQKEKELMALEQQKSDIQAKIDALNAHPAKAKFLPKLKSNTAPKKK